MPFSPRASEVAAVVAILTSDEHDDESSMGKAIVRALASELAHRELYVIYPNSSPVGYGPYFSEKDAERAWTKELGPYFTGGARLLRTFGWTPPDGLNTVCECGHPAEQHVIPGPKNKPGKPSECGRVLSTGPCPCGSYNAKKVA